MRLETERSTFEPADNTAVCTMAIYMYPKLIHLDIFTGDQNVRVTEVPLPVTGD